MTPRKPESGRASAAEQRIAAMDRSAAISAPRDALPDDRPRLRPLVVVARSRRTRQQCRSTRTSSASSAAPTASSRRRRRPTATTPMRRPHVHEIVDTCLENLHGVEVQCACHVFGSTALQRVLKHSNSSQRAALAAPLFSSPPRALLTDKYGSHAVEALRASVLPELRARPSSTPRACRRSLSASARRSRAAAPA